MTGHDRKPNHADEHPQPSTHPRDQVTDEAAQIDQIASSRNWFRPAPTSSFYTPLQTYLATFQSQKDSSPSAKTTFLDAIAPALDKALQPVSNEHANEEAKSEEQTVDEAAFLDLWYSVFHAAKRIPWDDTDGSGRPLHGALVDVVMMVRTHVLALSSSSPSSGSQGTSKKDDGQGKDYAQTGDLPFFTLALREAHNDAPAPTARSTPSTLEVHAWTNLAGFLARLLAATYIQKPSISTSTSALDPHQNQDQDQVQDPLSLSTYALWALRSALETPFHIPSPATNRSSPCHLHPATLYILLASPVLFPLSQAHSADAPRERKSPDPLRGGELCREFSGFSKGRWAFWGRRFREIGQGDVGEEGRSMVGMAVGEMERVEREG